MTTTSVRIRMAEPSDAAAVLAMFDGIMHWLVAQGRMGQWGTELWSETPALVDRVVERIERRELRVAVDPDGGEVLGVVSLSEECGTYVSPPPEPELFINLLGTSRAAKGLNVGGLLLEEARAEARRRGLRLVRVDCYAGDDRKLNAWYVSQGFTEVGPFVVKREGRADWPGMLLAQYLWEQPGR
ncbi:MAG TPA: GNAT family N-acetyltransferase [Actinospica sp.]|jgi:GNAT superfamily N-acetyltransferase|nr:GNAT family N-acetyltransferase [Actinospica sp.]